MEIIQFIEEVISYIKTKWWVLVICGLLFAGGLPALSSLSSPYELPDQEAAFQDLYQRYEQLPANFQFIVKNQDGTLFTNSSMIDEYLSQDQVIAEVEAQTGIDFSDWKENEKLLNLYKNGTFRGGLGGYRAPSSDILTLRFLVGKSLEENMAIAQAYYDLIAQRKISLFDDKEVLMVNQVVDYELLSKEQFPGLTSPDNLSGFVSRTPKSYIVLGIAGFIGGCVLGTIGVFVLRFFDRKISYSFDYAWALEDQFLHFSGQDKVRLSTFIQAQIDKGSQVLSQVGQTEFTTFSDLLEMNPNLPSDVIILVQAGVTDKAWYHDQYQLTKASGAKILVIQTH